jgi:hypothetical protein
VCWRRIPPPPDEDEDDPPPTGAEEEEVLDTEFGPPLRRSTRMRRPTERYLEYLEQQNMAFAANADEDEEVEEAYYDALHEEDYRIQDEIKDPAAFISATDEGTMYYDQAKRPPNRQHFVEAAVKEVNDHITSKHWILIPRSQLPKGIKVLDSVLSMERKRDIKPGRYTNIKQDLMYMGASRSLQ